MLHTFEQHKQNHCDQNNAAVETDNDYRCGMLFREPAQLHHKAMQMMQCLAAEVCLKFDMLQHRYLLMVKSPIFCQRRRSFMYI